MMANHKAVPAEDREGEWIEAHLELLAQHAGQWVAIGPQGILAYDDDLLVVQELARQRGAVDPLFLQVPSEAEKSLPWAM
jgi:hypothetical protein